jgi:hypothetical protein
MRELYEATFGEAYPGMADRIEAGAHTGYCAGPRVEPAYCAGPRIKAQAASGEGAVAATAVAATAYCAGPRVEPAYCAGPRIQQGGPRTDTPRAGSVPVALPA